MPKESIKGLALFPVFTLTSQR